MPSSPSLQESEYQPRTRGLDHLRLDLPFSKATTTAWHGLIAIGLNLATGWWWADPAWRRSG
jgi:hypothetical protein